MHVSCKQNGKRNDIRNRKTKQLTVIFQFSQVTLHGNELKARQRHTTLIPLVPSQLVHVVGTASFEFVRALRFRRTLLHGSDN